MNPSIANKLFPNYIFSHNFEISSVHKVIKGTRALTFPVLNVNFVQLVAKGYYQLFK